MFFVGVILDSKKFDILKKIMQESTNKNNINLININRSCIKNMKNIKFDSIVICDSLYKLDNELQGIRNICKQSKYLLINSDIDIDVDVLEDCKSNIITYGLNHKSTVTVSSITDESVLVSVQRNFNNIENNLLEVGEYNIKISKKVRTNIQELLIGFILFFLYDEKIIEQIL